MEKKTGLKKIMNMNTVAIITAVLFFISLWPIIYVGMFNFATGDDYWFGVNTYRGWVEGGLFAALKGSLQTVAEFYESWQGTWFTIFLFTLSPNHFVENGYVITVFISLGLLMASYAYLADFYLIKKLGFRRSTTTVIVCLISYLSIQYIPRTTSGIYWFNGIMHYSVPFFLAVLAIVHSHKFMADKKKKDYIILFIAFTLLGGGSYLAPMAATLAVLLILCYQIEVKEFDLKSRRIKLGYDFRNLWILPALMTEMIGLLISFLAPGNHVRGGEEFGFSLKWALECIYYAIDRGIYLGEDYFLLNGVTTSIYLLLVVLLWHEIWKLDHEKLKFPLPFFFVLYLNGIYWAIYTPEIYSRSDVSGGVPNTYFHVFLLITLGNMIYVHGWFQKILKRCWRRKAEIQELSYKEVEGKSFLSRDKFASYVFVPLTIILIVAAVCITYNDEVPTTNDYCRIYIQSGKMEHYKGIRQEQHRILSDGSTEDAVIPETTAWYPLLHMNLTEDENNSRNIDRAKYYNKNSVKAEMVD